MTPTGDEHTVDGRLIDVAVTTIMDGIGTGDEEPGRRLLSPGDRPGCSPRQGCW